jgi:hypothetical protein
MSSRAGGNSFVVARLLHCAVGIEATSRKRDGRGAHRLMGWLREWYALATTYFLRSECQNARMVFHCKNSVCSVLAAVASFEQPAMKIQNLITASVAHGALIS